jgi:GNAT superfamily N-acetyltransferase
MVTERAGIAVSSVRKSGDIREFVGFPWQVYRRDPNWVPPIWRERDVLLDRERNPFFRQGEAELYLARRGGRTVGTIAVGIDAAANLYRHERAAFFGLFETIQDEKVARALLAAARSWAESHGATVLRGPSDLTASQPSGILVEGFDSPPVVMTGHAPPYSATFLERSGFRKWGADHLAYQIDLTPFQGDPARLPQQLLQVTDKLANRRSARVRSARLADWTTETELAGEIYNESLASLSEFVPVGQDEFSRLGEAMRPILDPEMVLFVEVAGRAVGFVVALPDVNRALRHADGLRHPWDYLAFWCHRHRIDRASLKIVALRPAYQGRGLGALLYRELAERLLRKGYRWLDLSLTGEDNPQTNRLAAMAGARIYKRYRTYELALEKEPETRSQDPECRRAVAAGHSSASQEAG